MSLPGIIRLGLLHIRFVAVDVSKCLGRVEENRVWSHTNLIPFHVVSPLFPVRWAVAAKTVDG